MSTASDTRIYVDLEYLYPGMTKEKGRPSPAERRQIVQIAAIRIDNKTGKELAAFDVLTRPVFEEYLPPFFTELTGITQAMVERRAVSFEQGLKQFVAFCEDTPVWTFDADWGVFMQNCDYLDMPFAFASTPFIRVKPLLQGWGLEAAAYSSGTLHQAAGITMSGHVHNALHDVRSMAAAVQYFERAK